MPLFDGRALIIAFFGYNLDFFNTIVDKKTFTKDHESIDRLEQQGKSLCRLTWGVPA